MAKLDEAIQRLYESDKVRDELNDDEAKVLLNWGADFLRRMAPQLGDDEALIDERARGVQKFMSVLNRFVGKRAYCPAEEQQALLERVVSAAGEAQLPISTTQLDTFQQQHAALDNITALHTALALVDAQSATSADAAAQLAAPADAAAPSTNSVQGAGSLYAAAQPHNPDSPTDTP
jgi:O-methyltransferase involved in polyketide biosynthesis